MHTMYPHWMRTTCSIVSVQGDTIEELCDSELAEELEQLRKLREVHNPLASCSCHRCTVHKAA